VSESARAWLWLFRRLHYHGAGIEEAAWVLDLYEPGADPWDAADRLLGEWLNHRGTL
jgi:hypothetical protein